jgi:hypothetical protein
MIEWTIASGFEAKVAATHSRSVLLNSLKPPALGFAVLISNKNISPPSFTSFISTCVV